MGLLSLVFKKVQRTRIESDSIDGTPIVLEIDATTSMTHERAATPTKNPIETGSNITDHVTLENDRLTIEGVITDNPLTLIQSVQTVLSRRSFSNPLNVFEQAQTAARQIGSVGNLLLNNESRVENGFRYLEEIHRNRIPFSIVTGLKLYKNMILTSLSIPQTSADGDSIRFSGTFESINIVESQLVTVEVENVIDDVKHTAQKTINAGKQTPNEVTDIINERASVFYKAFKKVL